MVRGIFIEKRSKFGTPSFITVKSQQKFPLFADLDTVLNHYFLKSVLTCQFSWIMLSIYKWWEKAKFVDSNAFILVRISIDRYDGKDRAIYLKKNNQ